MKISKTLAAAALLATTTGAQAAMVDFAGSLNMVAGTGFSFGIDPNVTGTLDFDAVSGGLTGNFGGSDYTADLVFVSTEAAGTWSYTAGAGDAGNATYTWGASNGDVDLPAGGVVIGLLFNWDGTPSNNIPVLVGWADTVGAVVALDLADTDIQGGTAMQTAPFPGTNAQFDGSLTPVPLPAAAWLFGSAALGLIGLGRRRASKAA